MTEEQKQLLMKDLCGRLPYGVNVLHVKEDVIGVLSTINIYVEGREQKLKCSTSFFGENSVPIEEFKPYLYPLSSMTEEQEKEYYSYLPKLPTDLITPDRAVKLFDWLNKYHFDYRGLIGQGLANDATGIIMYNKERLE